MTAPAFHIEIDRLNKHYAAYHALRDIDLRIPKGAFVALVGPSGCGKSTLLRTLAGLESASSGDIRIAGESVVGRPPRERDVAMVFQSYALYPHMTVERNMNFSLRLRRTAPDAISTATGEAATILGLKSLLDRLPRQLSGGQRQRVAMGRAIVRQPKVFLFDEPLSNLDAALRVHMRGEIRKLHDRLGATSVYVTHDQVEAMTLADHIVVLRAGIVEQQGVPLELYDHPANTFVAGFLGSPAMNFLHAATDRAGTVAVTEDGGARLALARPMEPDRRILLGLRPEHVAIVDPSAPGALTGVIDTVETTGSATFLKVALGGAFISVARHERVGFRRGDTVNLAILPCHVHVFDPVTQAALGPS